ncbi:MAG: GAF domain-containing protein, partial [Chloroflexi bacterium]|nr:GAF domain-containing protein [Chloroflexota bacterium]
MATPRDQIEDLTTLNHIAETLNRAVDVYGALQTALVRLVELMRLETGWIFLVDQANSDKWWGKGYTLVAHHNLPPALALDSKSAWYGGCDCQGLCRKANVTKAYNEVECSRLADATGDRRGLAVHASAPLKNGETLLGILNVAAPDWSAFSPRSLALLNNAATMFAAALERAQLYDLLRERRIEEHASLLKFSRKLLAQHDLEGLMDYLVCEVCSLMQVDACALLLRGDVPEMLCFQATHGWKTAPVSNHRRVAYGSGTALGDAFHAQEAVFVQDLNDPSATQWQLDWLIEEDFRGHAAIPLVVDGGAIGVLLINTRQPHVWDADDARFLSLMSSQAALALEKARLHRAEIETMRLEEELAIGREIQLSLLPEACPTLPGWDFAAFYQPARLVGGDFYDFFILPDGQLGIVVADVAGKGVPAALFMALSRTVIRTSASNDCT